MKVAMMMIVLGLVGAVSGQSIFLREVAVPFGSINELGNWIQQVPRAQFLDCPTNENRFGLVCDPAALSRDDLDNYFCGGSPQDFGWCGAYWTAMASDELNELTFPAKRGISNGAVAINTNPVTGDAYSSYQMYTEMFGRVCACHCGCAAGCHDNMVGTPASELFCGVATTQEVQIELNIWAYELGVPVSSKRGQIIVVHDEDNVKEAIEDPSLLMGSGLFEGGTVAALVEAFCDSTGGWGYNEDAEALLSFWQYDTYPYTYPAFGHEVAFWIIHPDATETYVPLPYSDGRYFETGLVSPGDVVHFFVTN